MINIIKSPSKYTPSGNPIFLTVQSNNNNIVYFKIELKDKLSNDVISSSKAFVTPVSPNIGSIDLSNILSNYVDTPITTDSTFFTSYDEGYIDYKISVTEMITSGNTTVSGATITSTGYTVYNASYGDSEFQYYGYRNYYLNDITTAKFLSTKPSVNNVNPWSKEYLYFLADNNSGVNKVCISLSRGGVIELIETDISIVAGKIHRLNISPKDLKNTLGIDFDDVQYYEVWIEDNDDRKLTEIKRYRCVNYGCRNEVVNVIWKNNVGGVDSYSFINPMETKKVTRSTIKTNKYKDYSISANGVINTSERTYKVDKISEYTLNTNILNDWEYIYLTDMLASEQVYIELNNGTFLPIKLLTSSSDVKRKKYSTSSLRFELKFEAESNLNIVPDSYLTFSNGLSMIGFSVPTLLSVPSNYFESVIGDGTSIYFTLNHDLASTNIAVDLVMIGNGQTVYGDVVRLNDNTISIEFAVAIATNAIKVMISKLD